MTADERALTLNCAINDVRRALLNPAVRGERRVMLRDELDALRLVRVGIRRPGQRAYLRMLGLAPSGAVRRARV
jgi:hypothetical protein